MAKRAPAATSVPLRKLRSRVYRQGSDLGIVPAARPSAVKRAYAMGYGLALFVRSQFARSNPTLTENYISELGLDGSGLGSGAEHGSEDDVGHRHHTGLTWLPVCATAVHMIRGPPTGSRDITWRPRSSRGPPTQV